MLKEIDKPILELMNVLPQVGKVVWIGVREERKSPMKQVQCVAVSSSSGLDADHFSSKLSQKRQITLIQGEHLDAVASLLRKQSIDPKLTRRNMVVRGINLFALKGRRFQIGEAILEGTGYCHPCSRMEENLGEGGYNAMRGHGGITARVVKDGIIHEGGEVKMLIDG